MSINPLSNFWPGTPIGQMSDEDKGLIYDTIPQEGPDNFTLFGTKKKWESKSFRLGVLLPGSSTFVPAEDSRISKLPAVNNSKISIYLTKYFAAAMPGNHFDLQFSLGAQHQFEDNVASDVGHSRSVQGLIGDYVNILNVPYIRGIKVGTEITLKISINFLSSKSDERILRFLKSDLLKQGINLTNTYNPIFGVAVGYIRGLTETLLTEKKNTNIINCEVGFQHEAGDLGFWLREASYLFVQVPGNELSSFNWRDISWNQLEGRVYKSIFPLDYNHLLLRFERFAADKSTQPDNTGRSTES